MQEMEAKVSGYVDLLLTIFGWRDAIDIPGLKDVMDGLLSTLLPVERVVLDRSFGLSSGSMLTYEEIANELKTTAERVEEHLTIALRKLRHPSRSRRLKPFIDAITPGETHQEAQPVNLEKAMSWQQIRMELLRRKAAGKPVATPIRGIKNWIDEVGNDYVVVRSERTGRQRKIKASEIEALSTPHRRIKVALKALGDC